MWHTSDRSDRYEMRGDNFAVIENHGWMNGLIRLETILSMQCPILDRCEVVLEYVINGTTNGRVLKRNDLFTRGYCLLMRGYFSYRHFQQLPHRDCVLYFNKGHFSIRPCTNKILNLYDV